MIRCKTCGEESGGFGSSMYGKVHKYGPRRHRFRATKKNPRLWRALPGKRTPKFKTLGEARRWIERGFAQLEERGMARKRRRRVRRNVAAGYQGYDDDGKYRFHPIRSSFDYDPSRVGEKRSRKRRGSKGRKRKGHRRNPMRNPSNRAIMRRAMKSAWASIKRRRRSR
jgi:hypothetical protein